MTNWKSDNECPICIDAESWIDDISELLWCTLCDKCYSNHNLGILEALREFKCHLSQKRKEGTCTHNTRK